MPESYHVDCTKCNGSEKARTRQFNSEQRVARFDEKVQRVVDISKNYMSRISKDKIIAAVDRADERIMDSYSRLENFAERWYAGEVFNPRRPSKREAVVASTLFATLAQPATAIAMDQPTPFTEDPQAYSIAENIVTSMPSVEKVEIEENKIVLFQNLPDSLPVADSQETDAYQVNHSISVELQQPLERHILKGQTISHFAKALLGEESEDSQKVNKMIAAIAELNDIDISADEHKVIPAGSILELPIEVGQNAHTVEKGESASELYNSLGWKDAGYSFDEFVAANGLIDPAFIRIGWQVLRPPNSHSNIEVPEIKLKHDVVESAMETVPVDSEPETFTNTERLTEAQAAAAVEKLIEVVEAVEEPIMLVSDEHIEIPVSEKLAHKKEELVEQISSGETNLAYVQSEALEEIMYEAPNYNIHDVARIAIRTLYQNHNVEVSHELISDQASMIVEGIVNPDQYIHRFMEEDLDIDFNSETLYNIENQIETEKENAINSVEHASELISILNPDLTLSVEDTEKLVSSIVEMNISEKSIGDALYVATEYIASKDSDLQVENYITNYIINIYNQFGASELLENPEYSMQIQTQISHLGDKEYVDLAQFINEREKELETVLAGGLEISSPIIAEFIAIDEGYDNLDDSLYNQVLIQAVLGANEDQLKMHFLSLVAEANGESISEQIENYFVKAYASYGLNDHASKEKVISLTEESLRQWQINPESFSGLNAESIIQEEIAHEIEHLSQELAIYIDGAEVQPSEEIIKIAVESLNSASSSAKADVEFIKALVDDSLHSTSVAVYLTDYYQSQNVEEYIEEPDLIEITKSVINGERTPESFVELLERYSGIPSELFPDGKEYVLNEYEAQDLSSLISELGLTKEQLLDSAYNSHIVEEDGKLIAKDQPTIWLAENPVDREKFTELYNSEVLKIKPVVTPVEREAAPGKYAEAIENSLDLMRVEDSINNLDRTVDAVNSWYNSIKESDPLRPEEAPDDYVRMPYMNDLQGYSIVYTKGDKAAITEDFASVETIAVAIGLSEMWHQLVETKYPEYEGSMIRFRDFNSAHHRTHHDGRHIDLSTHMSGDITKSSTGPAMDYVSGDGTNNDYNFELNADFAVSLASFRIDGKRAVSSILTTDSDLVREVNQRVGFRFMIEVPYHGEHWHINTSKSYAIEEWRPHSPFHDLGHKGDLGIGGEYIEIPEDLWEQQHGSIQRAITNYLESNEVESLRMQNDEYEDNDDDDEEIEETSEISEDFEQKAEAQKDRFLSNINQDLRGVSADTVKELFTHLHNAATARGIYITDEGYVAVLAHAWGESRMRPDAKGQAGEGGIWQWKGGRGLNADGNPADLSTMKSNVEHFFYDAARDSGFLQDIQNSNNDLHEMVTEGYAWERPASWFSDEALSPEKPLNQRSRAEQEGTFRWGVAEELWADLQS